MIIEIFNKLKKHIVCTTQLLHEVHVVQYLSVSSSWVTPSVSGKEIGKDTGYLLTCEYGNDSWN